MDDQFVDQFLKLPRGYSNGCCKGRRCGVTVSFSNDGKRHNFFAEELGGTDRVSFNLYILETGKLVSKPCKMAREKVIDYLLNFQPAAAD